MWGNTLPEKQKHHEHKVSSLVTLAVLILFVMIALVRGEDGEPNISWSIARNRGGNVQPFILLVVFLLSEIRSVYSEPLGQVQLLLHLTAG